MEIRKEKHKNVEMAEMLNSLEGVFEKSKGLFGYAVARNARMLGNATQEYIMARDAAIAKYGTVDQETGTAVLDVKSENFKSFSEEMLPIENIEHEVEIIHMRHDELPEDFNAMEILQIFWMIADADDTEWIRTATEEKDADV